MNYYAARQRASDQCWDWTRLTDKMISSSGPCAIDSCKHKSKEEAEKHFFDHELSNTQIVNCPEREFHQCDAPGCLTKTQKGVKTRIMLMTALWLCDLHLGVRKDVLEMLNPFKPGIEIWASW